jgi:hypothetical protein
VISEILKMFALQKYIKKKKQEYDLIHEKKKEIVKFMQIIPKYSNP